MFKWAGRDRDRNQDILNLGLLKKLKRLIKISDIVKRWTFNEKTKQNMTTLLFLGMSIFCDKTELQTGVSFGWAYGIGWAAFLYPIAAGIIEFLGECY